MEQVTSNQENILKHSRSARIPISHGKQTTEFRFTFTRSDIADFFVDLAARPEMDVARTWTLKTVDDDQRELFRSIINEKGNMTVEQGVMRKLGPFLKQNDASIGELIAEN